MGAIVATVAALPASSAMAMSQSAFDRPLPQGVELSVVELTTAATALGAFQRRASVPTSVAAEAPVLRRGSGGPWVHVGPGTLHVLLTLTHPGALVPCDPRRIVNRHVRPLLRALTKQGALAHYFGRDWLSVAHVPAGEVVFGHDSLTGRTVFEAFIAVRAPFAPSGRTSFLGKAPGTLEAITGRKVDVDRLSVAIVDAYAHASGREIVYAANLPAHERLAEEVPDEPPWAATVDEAVGEVAAGFDAAGVFRLGGDLLASRDALGRVSHAVGALPPHVEATEIGAVVDRELGPPSVALDGVRDLRNVRDVLLRARQT
jgi:hypothetical protein